MSGKAALKAINDAIRQQDFENAAVKAKELLSKDPQNYQGHIFLAFALDKQHDLEGSEKIYQKATELKPHDAPAWQGLIKLFEQQEGKKLNDYQQVAIRLAQIFHDAEDMYKCQDVVDKFVGYARVNGDPLQYADALWIRVPESPIYPLLEGRFPEPAKTYETIAHILEEFEKKKINNLIGERRTRLGARLDEVKIEAKREVYGQSKLEHIYRQLINWTSDDEIRRQFEEKLLQFCYEKLLAAPAGDAKQQELDKVMGLANDMVIIRHPYKLAWDIAVNWKDEKETRGWDVQVLRSYCSFFPESDLYKIVTAYLTSIISPFPKDQQQARKKSALELSEDSDDDDDGGVQTHAVPLTDEDRALMLTEGITTCDSTLGYRLAGEYFLHTGEYEMTVELMRKAKLHLKKEQRKSGIQFLNTDDAYSLSLGTALVYYQSPRHHQEAKNLFDEVLKRDSSWTPALIGIGLIFEEEEDYDEAIDFFARALDRDGSNLQVRSESAWVKALKGDWQAAKQDLEEFIPLMMKSKDPAMKSLLADAQYRLGSCLWNLDTSREARKQRKGECAYAYWLNALKNDVNHAPSYTALGIFYSDYAKDKQRSRRCLQKALELSPSEVVAAERLARSFATDGDWDRVELVAQRVVDSGKVKPPPGSKRKGISWPFAALGVAELNKQDFHKAIVSFQSALRISPDDYHSWIGLGESYHSSGRFVAATKAMSNARRLEEELEMDISADAWFTKYMLANVKRELGDYDDAIELYKQVLETHQGEQGVVLAFMQTMVDNALTSVEKGLFGKSATLAAEVLNSATSVPEKIRETFNFWKSMAEACSVFVAVQSHISNFPWTSVQEILAASPEHAFEALASIDKVAINSITSENANGGDTKSSLRGCVDAMLLCHKQALHVSSTDLDAQSIGYYNLGWAEYRAHSCLSARGPKASSPYLRAAVRAFKRAIELEAGNSDFWNALGVVTSEVNPSVSQHAFVRSLHINERSPVGWVNLGTLALLSGDMNLANAAFTRGQSADPDYAHAWLGQGFVALMCGEKTEARALFTHAMDIAEASSAATRRHYSASMFDYIITAPKDLTVASLIQPLFALNQIRALQPGDLAFNHMSALLLERTQDNPRAVERLEEICGAAESAYEETESSESLARFTLARTDLARAYLAAGSYDKAMECGELALDLSADESSSELSAEQSRSARLSAHLTVGLAKYFANDFDEALTFFESALEESNNNPDATCLLAQVLWAQGSEASRDRARTALFEVIENRPGHVQSVLLLGVIALLDNDGDSLEAVTEELVSLRTNEKVTNTEKSQVGEVLQAIATLGEGKTEADVVAQVQSDVMLYPFLPHGWSALTEVTSDEHTAQMALKVARMGIPPKGQIECEDLARAHSSTASAADAQRALLLAPWQQSAWEGFKSATASV